MAYWLAKMEAHHFIHHFPFPNWTYILRCVWGLSFKTREKDEMFVLEKRQNR